MRAVVSTLPYGFGKMTAIAIYWVHSLNYALYITALFNPSSTLCSIILTEEETGALLNQTTH